MTLHPNTFLLPDFLPPVLRSLLATSFSILTPRSAGKYSDATSLVLSPVSALDNSRNTSPLSNSSPRKLLPKNPNSDLLVSSSKVWESVCFQPSSLLSFSSSPFWPAKNLLARMVSVSPPSVCFPPSESRLPRMLSDLLLTTLEVSQKWLNSPHKFGKGRTPLMLLVTPPPPPEKDSRLDPPSSLRSRFLLRIRQTLNSKESTSRNPPSFPPPSLELAFHTSLPPSP